MPSNPADRWRRVFPTAHRLALERMISERLPTLTGEVLVLGAGHDPYRHLLKNASSVLTTDLTNDHGGVDQVADAHDLPFQDNMFDGVVANELFEHLVSPSKASAELLRVLKPGGKAVVTIPFMFRIHGDPYDFTRFTKSGLEELFAQASSVSITEMGGRLHVISDIVTTAMRPLAAVRFVNHMFRLPVLSTQASRDCPSGYWVDIIK